MVYISSGTPVEDQSTAYNGLHVLPIVYGVRVDVILRTTPYVYGVHGACQSASTLTASWTARIVGRCSLSRYARLQVNEYFCVWLSETKKRANIVASRGRAAKVSFAIFDVA